MGKARSYILYDSFDIQILICELICSDTTQISGGLKPRVKGGASEKPEDSSGDAENVLYQTAAMVLRRYVSKFLRL